MAPQEAGYSQCQDGTIAPTVEKQDGFLILLVWSVRQSLNL